MPTTPDPDSGLRQRLGVGDYPASGGTYVYGRERLGEFWGFLAGWGFVIGQTASCAAMALTVGAYVWPDRAHVVAVAAVAALTAVNYRGVQKSALLTRIIVAVVLAVLVAVVIAALTFSAAGAGQLAIGSDASVRGVLQAAGLLFFAFAGYARIATLGEEVRDPARTIPRAIPAALGIALAVYATVAISALVVLGPHGLGSAAAPLADTVRAAGVPALVPVVRVGAATAAAGSLLALVLGVSRTPSRWPVTGICPTRWRRYIPASRCPITPSWPSAWSSRCSPPSSTCAARSGSPPSACWPITPSPTPPPGRSLPAKVARPARFPRSGWRGA